MYLGKFRFQIILRVSLLLVMIYVFFLLLKTSLLATTIICGAVIIFQVYDLIHYVERTNKYLTRFLDAIRYADFSQSFSTKGLDSSFSQLSESFTEVMQQFQRIRSEKEQNYQYLQTVVEHIGVGLLAMDTNGDILLMNRAAKKLLNKFQLKNIVTLASQYPQLVETLFRLKAGEKALVKYVEEDEWIQLMIYATEFRMKDQAIKLVSLQNIQSELEEKEMEAWQKLIRVLTHEIMNSVTPISSLSHTVNDLLADIKEGDHIADNIADVSNAIQTIHKRSEGLLHFVQAYRSLTKLPKPDFQIFTVTELFDNMCQLMEEYFNEKEISIKKDVNPASLELTGDPKLIEQVLLNLIKNAIEALEGVKYPRIELCAFLDRRSRVIIQISDNGPGISEEAQEKMFIPFYTTKKGGSGIGLSLSRQILRLHKGTISFQSEPHVKTTFKLTF